MKLAILSALVLFLGCGGPPAVNPVSPSTPPGRVVGALEWPVRGALVSAYRPPNRQSHAGVDLASPPGTTVIAAEAGNVAFIGEIRGYEKVIAVSHPGDLTTVYAHLGEVRVREGAEVARGQAIATIGNGGYLHYEIRRAKQPIDPADLYAVGPSPDEWATSAAPAADVTAEPSADVPIGSPRPAAPPSAQRTMMSPSAPRASLPPPVETRRAAALEPPPPPEPAPIASSGGTLGGDAESPPSTGGASSGSESSMATAAVVGANVLYVPAKLAYAGLGAVTGVFVLAASQDGDVAGRFWNQTLGGDYFVTHEHLYGERGVRWMGRND